ncbi:lasso peptide isopeptide bond-forming cyclase [Ferviditalea candida]|uniref:asparagine synthase (glutamine-hydrolyzing) n=1 Tax=Ferviditalea candida TaxID=3108399 RepID=A0ABU5ZEW8_9BACL|nr:lasso peptide isopeptide bond-forming cyclase [Paenibacillaceae bacterium T2]
MSAIAGIYQFNEGAWNPEIVEHSGRLMDALRKFPADDVRTWHSGPIFLGCHAQWITPESVEEQLPYFDSERKLAITADAIIDNRQELFDLLQIERGRREQMTDSELILLAYRSWEEDAPKYLIGDFAFMIWDERKRKLFGARDFSGGRTLYYYRDAKRFAFCTIIQPLFSLPYIGSRLNEEWLAEFLAISGMNDAVDASITSYQNIEQIPPSHSISIENGHLTLARYCTLASGKVLKLRTNEDYVEAFREVFQEAVTSRLRTHRPVGAQLSGGLDSGAVVSFAAKALRAGNRQMHTFSYIPPSDFKDFTSRHMMADERPYIKSTVQYVGGIIDHYLDFAGRDPYTEVDDFLELMEMPYKFFENSFWLKGMFEKAHEQGIGVLLNGGRGNLSISWGSAIDYYAILLKRLKWLRLYHELDQYSRNRGGNRLRRLPVIAKVAFPLLARMFPSGTSYQMPMLINKAFARRTNVFEKLQDYGIGHTGWFSESNIYKQRQRHFEDVFHWNASNTLAAKLSLPYSVWKRDPTNDVRVIRFCLSLPEEQYVQNGLDRALIRRSTEQLLPDQVRLNQRVRGVQGVDWVHRMIPHWKTFIEEIKQLSSDKRMLEYVDGEAVKAALAKVRDGVRPEYASDPGSKLLMRSLIVYRFLKKYI